MAEKTPLLERWGVTYLKRRAKSVTAIEAEDEVHVLNPREQAALRRVVRGVVARAALAGALSALVSALAELYADTFPVPVGDAIDWGYLARYWGTIAIATVIASALELAFLYFDSLEGVHRLAVAAGLPLFDDRAEKSVVASALARAALELPNPIDTPYRLDPHRDVSKPRLLLITLLYKLKIGLTSFLLKTLLRRLLGRALVRVWLVFVGVPVTAAWNALVAWRVIREARVRAMGPSAAHELVGRLFGRHGPPSQALGVAALRAVGACIVCSADLHPNLLALFELVRERVPQSDADLGDVAALASGLRELTEAERRVVLALLAIGVVLDGRLNRRERALFHRMRVALGLDPGDAALRDLHRAFLRGRPLDDALLERLTHATRPQ
ncbi:MAG: hypothetical protein K8H88_30105 [Sandaracinaceae bacterium]|nr:hypothetical protein [Sandaracinaceae bacterium]